jgi:hypothetical protein
MTSQLVSWSHTIRITNAEMEEGELPKDSIAKVDRITSLHQELIMASIGRIKKHTFDEIKDMLLQIII